MLKVPPTRIPLATVQVGNQKVELFLSPEWARYFESLNTRVLTHSAALEQSAALTAFLGEQSEAADTFPGPPGPQGMEGLPGAALFMLMDDSAETQMIVPDQSAFLGSLGSMAKQQANAVAITGGTVAGLASLDTVGPITALCNVADRVGGHFLNSSADGSGMRVAGGRTGAGYVASFNTYDGTNVGMLTGDGNFALSSVTAGAAAPAVAPGQVAFGAGTSTTVGAPGAAAALPATPAGYLIFNNGGTNQKIPFYNA